MYLLRMALTLGKASVLSQRLAQSACRLHAFGHGGRRVLADLPGGRTHNGVGVHLIHDVDGLSHSLATWTSSSQDDQHLLVNLPLTQDEQHLLVTLPPFPRPDTMRERPNRFTNGMRMRWLASCPPPFIPFTRLRDHFPAQWFWRYQRIASAGN